VALQAEVERLKQKLNLVISSAEESLQSASEAQEEVKATFIAQQEQLLEENKRLTEEKQHFHDIAENKKEKQKEKNDIKIDQAEKKDRRNKRKGA
jgi:thermostable 8-oxoguanine DNA glycosylase